VEKQLYIAESYRFVQFQYKSDKENKRFYAGIVFANNMFRSYPVVELKRSPGVSPKEIKISFSDWN
jgi:predicted nuclease of restriction endonuclease-like (RecB) superfamily